MAEEQNKKIGERLRDITDAAFNDPMRQAIQLQILNDAFEAVVDDLMQAVEQKLAALFNQVAKQQAKAPESVNAAILKSLTTPAMGGEPQFSPLIKCPVPVVATYAHFTAEDICELPPYIRLHEMARDMDVAVRVNGPLPEEGKSASMGFPLPVMLIVDCLKTYEEGALEGGPMYPHLPEKKAEFDRRQGGKFNLNKKP